MPTYQLHQGDALHVLKQYADDHFESIVTDAPYGLGKQPDPLQMLQAWCAGEDYKPGGKGFMGREWDCFVPQPSTWKEAYRVLKPGGYLLCFAGTRTYDLMTLSLRLAGFQIQDCIRSLTGEVEAAPAWVCGQGKPATTTRLKPGWEPVIVAYRPGRAAPAMNIDECRIPADWQNDANMRVNGKKPSPRKRFVYSPDAPTERFMHTQNRWPANVVHDGNAAVLGEFASFGEKTSGKAREGEPGKRNYPGKYNTYGDFAPPADGSLFTAAYGDTGTAARFFYSAKASPNDRSEGCERLFWRRDPKNPFGAERITEAEWNALPETQRGRGNVHPTVKPTALMQWLVRLVTPKGGVCLDLFCGSGSTGKACMREGLNFVGIDLFAEPLLIAEARIEHALTAPASTKVKAVSSRPGRVDLFTQAAA